ncbi:hypothetical protein ZTR_06259 [Talaromyces verruculosus]|nr:hypothetical protein ZTR_06259 [Talaromyces verruculosus]
MILLKLITAVAALAATATAGVVRRDADSAQVVTPNQLQLFSLYEQFSAAAYCTRNELVQPGTVIACNAGNCPTVEEHGATVEFSFLNEGDSDVTGFIAVDNDPLNPSIVLAFRGVRSIETGLTKLNTRLVPNAACGAGCEVHEGFQKAWDSVAASITRQLTAIQAVTTLNRLVITGHGVGGALATLAALQYRTDTSLIPGIPATSVQLYTYGSPRVGNRIFARSITGGTTNVRVTHTDDPIPKFPRTNLGYVQWGPEFWIRSPTGQPVRTADIDPVTPAGIENSNGNSGTPLSLNIPARLWYFNNVVACI